MRYGKGENINQRVRNFLFSAANREFLIFLFFLALSGSFWLLMALNDTYEKEVRMPVRLVGVPKNVVLTSDADDTLRVTLRDKGYMLCAYLYGEKVRRIDISFQQYIKKKGYGSITAAELTKLIYQELYSSTRVVSVKPDKLEYFYNYGTHKRLPVRLYGMITPGVSYYIARVEFSPKQVDVYGSQNMIDSLTHVYTQRLNIQNLTDTISREVSLKKVKGIKCVPSSVKIRIYPDILTEESVEVPVTAINMPEGKVLRTFPSRVKVVFTVGVSAFRNVNPNSFKVVVDYKEIMAAPSEKCHLKIVVQPHGIRNAHLDIPAVDYLIEEQ